MNINSSNSEIPVEYKSIDFDKVEDISLFKEFCAGLLTKEFPAEIDHDYLEIILNKVIGNSKQSTPEYYCVLAMKNENIIGGIIGNYYWKFSIGVIEYVAVNIEERGKRIASTLIKILTDYMSEKAKKYKYEMIDYFFLEIENPVKLDDPELRKKALIRLGFWDKVSVKTLEMEYIPPPFQKGKDTIDNIMLNVIVCSPKLKTTSISKETVLSFLHDFFQKLHKL
jgi:hypothetical protein